MGQSGGTGLDVCDGLLTNAGRWYEVLKMQAGWIGTQSTCTKVNFNKAVWGLGLLFYHLLAGVLTACWELSHLFHHTHPAT